VLVGLAMIGGGVGAGLFGSLLGLGGGILIVPLLTLGFGLPLREAVGVSLVSVIVTSSASAAVFLERHSANLRLGMTLELFTASGAIIGGLLAFVLDDRELAGLFAILLIYVAVSMLLGREPGPDLVTADAVAATHAVDATHATNAVDATQATNAVQPVASVSPSAPAGPPSRSSMIDRLSGPDYRIRRLGLGMVGSVFAGVVSALLGIGGGLVKVPVLHLVMGVPLRVATATSNLMIGITASASAIIYLVRGGIDPYVVGPTAIGVFLGASIGSRSAGRVDRRVLRVLFTAVLAYTAWQMIVRAVS
jgi:uncharacterized protein